MAKINRVFITSSISIAVGMGGPRLSLIGFGPFYFDNVKFNRKEM